jgi:hypothetical protein
MQKRKNCFICHIFPKLEIWSQSSPGIRLDYYQRIVYKSIMNHQVCKDFYVIFQYMQLRVFLKNVIQYI